MAAQQETVGVLGAGTMGIGISIVMLRAGHRVVWRDLGEDQLEAGLDAVRGFFGRSVKLGKLEEEAAEEMIARVSTTTAIEDLKDCGVVVEAIFEDTGLKASTFGELDDVCGQDTLFHTNTSTLSVAGIAAGSKLPERVVGTHYCNPAPLMKLVEVAKGQETSEDSYRRTMEFIEGLGKVSVTTRDAPGFIVNRFLIPFENDCIRALEGGFGTIESIDRAVTGELGYPMGTFRLLDVVGLDIHKAVSESLYARLEDPRCKPPPLVDEMIAAGTLGRKTGRGFYDYDEERAFGSGDASAAGSSDGEPAEGEDGQEALVQRLLVPYLNDAIQCLDDDLASPRDLDVAIELGLGYPRGPLRVLDEIGLDVHERNARALFESLEEPQFAPPPLLERKVEAGQLGERSGQGFRVGNEEEAL